MADGIPIEVQTTRRDIMDGKMPICPKCGAPLILPDGNLRNGAHSLTMFLDRESWQYTIAGVCESFWPKLDPWEYWIRIHYNG